MKKGYIANIEDETKNNDNFRKVLYTGEYSQLVVMSLLPGEDIGSEVHEEIDQFIRIEAGKGVATLNGVDTKVEDDWAIVVPAGAEHNITNTGDEQMKLYTIYSPADHKESTVHATKAEAEIDHDNDHFDGVTTE